jgi:hypothetical protein
MEGCQRYNYQRTFTPLPKANLAICALLKGVEVALPEEYGYALATRWQSGVLPIQGGLPIAPCETTPFAASCPSQSPLSGFAIFAMPRGMTCPRVATRGTCMLTASTQPKGMTPTTYKPCLVLKTRPRATQNDGEVTTKRNSCGEKGTRCKMTRRNLTLHPLSWTPSLTQWTRISLFNFIPVAFHSCSFSFL